MKRLITGLFIILSLSLLTTCDTSMGFGDPIDWEPPELNIDPSFQSPLYINNNTRIFGTAYDNQKVSRVIVRDSLTGAELPYKAS